MSSPIERLAQVFARDIPLSQAMGVQVLCWQDRQLRLQFPLAPNSNHQASMFGGSMYCAAVLAGWGWLHLALQEEGTDSTHIVVQSGQIDYPRPIMHDSIIALCQAPDAHSWQRFLTTYHKRGKARLQVISRVLTADGADGAVLTGQFVLHQG
ncbi:MAG: YiiD C-terminal domain-containing protein [Thiopseudomonas sp.]|nr:YiiD C-terminal domain-containing protein [Thiopseudomonas sp.]